MAVKRWDFFGGGEGGAQSFASKKIRAAFRCCTRDDDLILFTVKTDGLKTAGGWGGRDPPSANKIIRSTLPHCKHVGDMIFLP